MEDTGSQAAPGFIRKVILTVTDKHPGQQLDVEMVEQDGEGSARRRWKGRFDSIPTNDLLRSFFLFGATPE